MYFHVRIFQDEKLAAAYILNKTQLTSHPYIFNAAILSDHEPCLIQLVRDTEHANKKILREELLVSTALWDQQHNQWTVKKSSGETILRLSMHNIEIFHIPKTIIQSWNISHVNGAEVPLNIGL